MTGAFHWPCGCNQHPSNRIEAQETEKIQHLRVINRSKTLVFCQGYRLWVIPSLPPPLLLLVHDFWASILIASNKTLRKTMLCCCNMPRIHDILYLCLLPFFFITSFGLVTLVCMTHGRWSGSRTGGMKASLSFCTSGDSGCRKVDSGWNKKLKKKKQNKRYDTANVGFVGFYGKPITEKHNY